MQFNYQMRITVHKGSGTDSATDVYCNGHCRDDFGDIRWTRAGGLNLLDHWMESYASGNNAVFWVEVPFVPKSPGTIDAHMYYDKSDATSISSGDDTFIFFDHFDSDKGYWVDRNGTFSIANSFLTLTPAINYNWSECWRITDNTVVALLTNNYAVIIKQRRTSVGATYPRTGIVSDNNGTSADTSCMLGVMDSVSPNEIKGILDNRVAWSSTVSFSPTLNTWYWHELSKTGGDFRYRAWADGASIPAWEITWTRSGYTDKNIGVSSNAAVTDADLIFERKFVSPEPTWGSWGVQEIYEALVDALSLADAISTQLISAFKEISLTDGYTLADIVSIQEALYRTLTDSFSLADVSSTQEIYYRSLTDGHALADPLTIFRARLLSLVDGHDLADVLSTQETFYRLLTDGYTLADPITALRTRLLSLLDGHVLVDTTITQEIYARLFTDAYSLADPFTALRARLLSLVDGHRLTDVPSTQEIFYRALVDAYQLADPIATLRFRLLAISDGYALADITSVQEVHNRLITDFYNLADPITSLKFKLLGITDGYSLADVYSKQGVYNRLITDAFSFRDRLLRGAFIKAFLTDAYALSDLRSVIKNPIVVEKLILKLIRLIDLQGR